MSIALGFLAIMASFVVVGCNSEKKEDTNTQTEDSTQTAVTEAQFVANAKTTISNCNEKLQRVSFEATTQSSTNSVSATSTLSSFGLDDRLCSSFSEVDPSLTYPEQVSSFVAKFVNLMTRMTLIVDKDYVDNAVYATEGDGTTAKININIDLASTSIKVFYHEITESVREYSASLVMKLNGNGSNRTDLYVLQNSYVGGYTYVAIKNNTSSTFGISSFNALVAIDGEANHIHIIMDYNMEKEKCFVAQYFGTEIGDLTAEQHKTLYQTYIANNNIATLSTTVAQNTDSATHQTILSIPFTPLFDD